MREPRADWLPQLDTHWPRNTNHLSLGQAEIPGLATQQHWITPAPRGMRRAGAVHCLGATEQTLSPASKRKHLASYHYNIWAIYQKKNYELATHHDVATKHMFITQTKTLSF